MMRMSAISKGRRSGLCEACLFCFRNGENFACLAYPEKIPDKYWFNKELHTELVGDESSDYVFKKANPLDIEKYKESNIRWYSMERIKDMGLIKNKGEE